jgi:hypothetical protein
MSKKGGVYIFGIIQEKEKKQLGKAKLNGIENKIFTLPYKQIAAVVSRVKGEVLPNRNNLFTHQQAVKELINKKYTLIPMSFGNVFYSEKDVLLLMEQLYDDFEKLLLELENKIEVGLKVIPKKEWIDEEMEKDSMLQQWKNTQKEISNPSHYYEQIQLGELAKNFVVQLESEVEKEIYHPLLELAVAGKQNATVPGKTLLNAAFLIDCDKEEAFDQRVNELYEDWKDKVDFNYVGPWPAYNFVNIRLKVGDKND